MTSSDKKIQLGAGGINFGGGKPRKVAGFMAGKPLVDDPLANVPVTGNVETDAAAEVDALAQGFRDRRDAEDKRFKYATDSEYWFAVCFQNRDDKDAFLNAISKAKIGGEDKYIDGYKLAKALGIDLSE